MKINFIQISNILSFQYYENIEDSPKIEFNKDLNILIGQNGSGKSTVLEIINFIFKKVLFVEANFNQNQYRLKEQIDFNQKKDIFQKLENKQYTQHFRLEPNWDSNIPNQKIRMEIQLDSIDDSNIENLIANKDKIDVITTTYSRISIPISIVNEKKIIFDIELDHDANTYTTKVSENLQTGFDYLHNYNLYKELIDLYNKETSHDVIPLLYDSFILIGGYRNYHSFNPSISLQTLPANQIQEIRSKEYTRSINGNESGEPPIFNLVRLAVAEKHYEIFSSKSDQEECDLQANNIPFLLSINQKLKLINLECKIILTERRTWDYSFEFLDTQKKRILNNINSLSAGQKAIVHLIFEAYGRSEIKGGVVIIDEPEIHLHYQFQSEYMQIIKEINKEQKCQYILVTHSESLINSATIDKIKLFTLDNTNYTSIKSPTLPDDQKILIKILDNTRSTHAFFFKKIILVEGDTDRYFYKEILQLLKPMHIHDVTILDIGGKGNYKKWKLFFESFGLEVYYIGDFDNIFSDSFSEYCLITKIDQEIIQDKLKQKKLDNLSNAQKKQFQRLYDNLIVGGEFITKPNRTTWKNLIDTFINFVKISNKDITLEILKENDGIHEKIDNMYKNNIYILKKGELEDYFQATHGNLKDVISFCEGDLNSWLAKDNDEVKEIKLIFDHICDNKQCL